MASSSKGKEKCLSPRFYDYLNGIREEFELQSNATSTKSSSPRRFKIYLEGLKCEFELLEKDRAESVELLNARNFDCERCRKRATSAPQNVASSQAATVKAWTTPALFSRPFQFKTLDKPTTSQTLETTTRHSYQHTSLIRKFRSAIAPTRPSQSRRRPHSPLPASTAHPDSGPKNRDWSVTFNTEVQKELEVEMAHELIHGKRICCVKFSQDGKYLAAGCGDGKTYIYNVQSGTLTRVLRNLLAERDIITAVCFSLDGKCLATGSSDGNIYIWEIKTKYVRNAFKGHNRFINSLDFSPNRRLLLSAADYNTLRLWNIRDGAMKFLTDDNPTFLDYRSAVFSPDGRHVAASHRDGIVRIWDVRTGTLLRRVKAHMGTVFCVAFMPDGKGLLSGSWDTTVRYWDITSLHTTRISQGIINVHSQATGVKEQTRLEREFSGHMYPVYSIAISPDGRWVASGSADRSLRIWDTRNAAMQCISDDDWVLRTVDFSPAGGYLASGGEDGNVKLWRYSYIPLSGS